MLRKFVSVEGRSPCRVLYRHAMADSNGAARYSADYSEYLDCVVSASRRLVYQRFQQVQPTLRPLHMRKVNACA
jgi:hypothetical protein